MTLAVPGATGFVALAQRAVIGMRVSPRVGGHDAHEGFRRSVRGNGDRPGHLAMSPHPRPPHGRLTWMEPDGRHERTSAWQDRDAATAFEGRGSGVPAHPTGLLALSGDNTRWQRWMWEHPDYRPNGGAWHRAGTQ